MSDSIEQPKIRTEDLKLEEIRAIFVETPQDRSIIKLLKAATPTIVEGSRGTGKSFLMRVAEFELDDCFGQERVLPVYLSFTKSSLIYTGENSQFHSWMMAKLCSRVLRVLKQKNLISPINASISLLAGSPNVTAEKTKLETIVSAYELSFKTPGTTVDSSSVPSVDDFKDAIEDICEEHNISRFCLLFDEAVHIFRPEQQRQFFTLFRDLRSPYISCNAAVYPGVTSYGPVFEMAHDATLKRVERDVMSPDYLEVMRDIASKQVDSHIKEAIATHGESFSALAYAVTGNPRLLLKTLSLAPKLRLQDVNNVIKSFYRSTIWADHSALADAFPGHRPLIDWGRDFIEKSVLPGTKQKNERRALDKQNEAVVYFWIHRDAPERVQQAIRLLAYTGIVQKGEEGIRGTRSEIGTRYLINIGCVLAQEAAPVNAASEIVRNISIKRWTEFGANHHSYPAKGQMPLDGEANDTIEVLRHRLEQPVDILDISSWQRNQLKEAGLNNYWQRSQSTRGLAN